MPPFQYLPEAIGDKVDKVEKRATPQVKLAEIRYYIRGPCPQPY